MLISSVDPVIDVRGLKTHLFTGEGVIKAVDGVDFTVTAGEVLGLLGESGCGKTMTALSIIGLVPSPPGKILAGEILFRGVNLLSLGPKEIRRHRGDKISMIFQNPFTSLNPVLTVGTQVSEVFMFHRHLAKKKSWSNSIKMVRTVGIPSPEMRVKEYPHQLSGGMRQRAMIAMGLGCEPSLLIADEPTTALDVTVQAQILNLIKEMCHNLGTAVLLITHNMGIVAKMCDRVAVMYAGLIMEYTDVYTLFKNPQHPYTMGLLNSLPRLGVKEERLNSIKGLPPRLNNLPPGCPFSPRCPEAEERCTFKVPDLVSLDEDHKVRCIKRAERGKRYSN